MSGNSFGKSFVITTFGESHGSALGIIIDGCPPNLELDENDIQKELDKRRPGTSKYVTQRKESDKAQILSGVFEGKTTGTPITIIIFNEDQRSKDYGSIKDKFRPGHADYPYLMKYGIRDYRGGGRSSARETLARVAAGAIAKKLLIKYAQVEIFCYVSQIGIIETIFEDEKYIYQNPFAIANNKQIDEIAIYLDDIRKNHNSIGAKLTLIAKNVPVGLGEPVFDKLDADIAKAIMSINAVKAVEIGDGFLVSEKMGSENNDRLTSKGFLSNHAGGILGGLSTGQDIIVNFAIKPTSSITVEQDTIDINGDDTKIITKGRHDPCVALRAPVIAESMLALVLIDHILRDKSQCSDVKRQELFKI